MANEGYANNPSTSLSAAITSTSATSLTVASSSGFPSSFNFRILVESELMLVTAVSGTTWTVTRGVEGTTAATHGSGATVIHPLTTQALLNLVIQSHGGTVAGARRQLNLIDTSSVTWSLTDDPTNNKMDIQATATSTSGYVPPPGVLAPTAPVIGDFTTDASAITGASITSANAVIVCHSPGINSDACLVAYMAAPATPYSITAQIRCGGFYYNSSGGLMFRLSSTGQFHMIGQQYNGTPSSAIVVNRYTNNTTYLGTDKTAGGSGSCVFDWLKIVDDGTNRSFYASTDGYNWLEVYSVARGTFITPDQVGFLFNGNTNTSGTDFGAYLSIVSWSQGTS